jgi:competence protein ComGF
MITVISETKLLQEQDDELRQYKQLYANITLASRRRNIQAPLLHRIAHDTIQNSDP